MAKGKGGIRRAGRKAKAYLKRRAPRGGRMAVMFKTAIAVTGAALVGGAALNMVNTAKGKPTEGLTAGVVSGGAGLLLAFTLGLFKGTRQYVTPVLAGAAAVGALNAFSGPISRGSANIAKALLGEGDKGPAMAGERTSAKDAPKGLPAAQGGMKPVKTSKGEMALGIASSLAQLGASIAGNIQAGRSGGAGLTAGQRAVAAAAGLSDVTIGAGDDDADGSGYDDDDAEGSEGMDDFAIIGSSIMGESDE